MTQQTLKKPGRHRVEGYRPDLVPANYPLLLLRQTPAGSLHATCPTGVTVPTDSPNLRINSLLPTTLIERLRNAIYWTEQCTMARVIAEAIHDAVAEMEHTNGGTFPPRLTPLKRGRPRRTPLPQRLPLTEPLL